MNPEIHLQIQKTKMEQGTVAVVAVYSTDDDDDNDNDNDHLDDDDISVLSEKPAFYRNGSTSSNPILVDDHYHNNGDHIEISLFYGKPTFYSKKNPILVEKYSSSTQHTSSRGSRKSKLAIDLTQDAYYNFDQDDVQVFDPKPRKIFKGEPSNSKSNAFTSDIIDAGVDQTFLCDICVDEKPMSAVFRLVGCNHSYCSDCVANYVASKLQENISNISCPVIGCEGKLEPQHCSSILPRQVFDRWGDALCEALILASEKFYCPFKDCSSLLINDSNVVGVVIKQSECPDCKRLFCAQCKVPWHSEVSCKEFQTLNKNENSNHDIQLMKLAKEKKWKRCPKCKFYVQRSSGCLFMTCRCRCTFCYHCGAETKDHYCNSCRR